MFYDSQRIENLKARYPTGTRLECDGMNDPHPIPAGTRGTVEMVDDAGQIMMCWDNGRTLSLIPGEDSFHRINDQVQEESILKLYMPLVVDCYEYNEYGDLENDCTELDGRSALKYEDAIQAAVVRNRSPEERERGIMHWYDENDQVNAKVRSAEFSVENVNGRLMGVLECHVVGSLTAQELEALENYAEAHASDGWGEGFEQREIKTEDGNEIYVHLWNSGDAWRLCTEDELQTMQNEQQAGGMTQCQTM